MDKKSTTGGDADAPKRKVNSKKKSRSSTKKLFGKIFDEIKDNNIGLAKQIRSGEYFKINESLLRQKVSKDNDNILHYLSDEYQDDEYQETTDGEGEMEEDYEDVGDSENNRHMKSANSQSLMEAFVSGLLHNLGHLMLETGHKQRTPLFTAIENEIESIVTWMLEYSNIAAVLEVADSSGENCVHAVLKSDLPRDIMITVINNSTKKALKAQDERGRTPLHLAVEYKRCRPGQLEVIEALIQKGGDSLDIYTKYPTPMSVYQYHEHTRREYDAGLKKGQGTDRLISPRGPKVPATQAMGPHNEPRGPKGEPAKGINEENSRQEREQQHHFKGQNNPVALSEGEQANHSSGIHDMQELESCANKIKEIIKLHYLRMRRPERNPAKVASWLYDEKVGVVETYFDFIDELNGNDTIDWNEFEQGYDVLKFNSILKFVHFRKLKLKNPPEVGDGLTQDDIDGHADVLHFFDWLRRKEVKRILHVTVEEDPKRLHRDAAIKSALEDLKVEILDWQKPDISPEIIYSVGDHLKEVHLLWGGNNAILRAWSEPEGLGRLPSLKKIHLKYCDPKLEKSSHVVTKIKEFRQRMERVRRVNKLEPIEVIPPKDKSKNKGPIVEASTSSTAAPSDEKEQRGNTNKWLDCVDDFAVMLQNIKVEKLIADYSQMHPSLKELQKDVVVAVIDDGVDINQQCLRGRILRPGGETFDTSDRSHYRFSAQNHGTLMASQVVRVCPNAKIYVIKVNTFSNGDNNLAIDAESAVSAIEAAVRQHVDIIVMSWTIPKMEDYKVFEKAMNAALGEGILLFCSAADEGGYFKTTNHYPAACASNSVFKIGAARASGQVLESTALDEVDYILPGHEVYERKPKYSLVPKSDSHTGSSIANALAAGLAALILHCARLAAIHTMIDPKAKRKVSVDEVKSLKSYDRMKKAFGKFQTSYKTKNKFMEIWETLGKDFVTRQEWKGTKDIDKLPYIADIVSELLPT